MTPEKQITISGEQYTLGASMAVLKTLQQEFEQDIYDMASSGLLRMRFDQLARIIQVSIGEKAPEIGVIEADIVRARGLDETKFLLMEWLIGAVSKDGDREKNVNGLLERISNLRKAAQNLDSLSQNTSNSA